MVWRTLAVVCLLVVAGCTGLPAGSDTAATTAPTQAPATTTDESRQPTAWGEARVVVESEDGTELGAVDVRLAETREERYTGLSDTASLGPNEGMLFVYGDEAMRTYVMRSMSFPIDIVFVGANGRITAIHHAPVEDDNENLTEYRGLAKWVLEVPYNWTTEHDVEVGDRIRVED